MAPLQALGGSLAAAGNLSVQLANKYKDMENRSEFMKAENAFDMKLQEVEAEVANANSPEEIAGILRSYSSQFEKLVEELPSAVDSPELKNQLTNRLKLKSGMAQINLRKKMIAAKQTENEMLLENRLTELRLQGKHDEATETLWAMGEGLLSDAKLQNLQLGIDAHRDSVEAIRRVNEYIIDPSGKEPSLEGLLLDGERKEALEMAIARASNANSGSIDRAMMLSLETQVMDMVSQGISLDGVMEHARAYVDQFMPEHDRANAMADVKNRYHSAMLSKVFGQARLEGTDEAYLSAIEFIDDTEVYRRPEFAEKAAERKSMMQNLMSSKDVRNRDEDRVLARQSNVALEKRVMDLTHVGYVTEPGGDVLSPSEYAQELWEAAGVAPDEFPEIGPEGQVLTEGKLSAMDHLALEGQINKEVGRYQFHLKDMELRGTLPYLAQNKTEFNSARKHLNQNWNSTGFSIQSLTPDQMADPGTWQYLAQMVEAINRQGLAPDSMVIPLLDGTDLSVEEQAQYFENMSVLRERAGLDVSLLGGQIGHERAAVFNKNLGLYIQERKSHPPAEAMARVFDMDSKTRHDKDIQRAIDQANKAPGSIGKRFLKMRGIEPGQEQEDMNNAELIQWGITEWVLGELDIKNPSDSDMDNAQVISERIFAGVLERLPLKISDISTITPESAQRILQDAIDLEVGNFGITRFSLTRNRENDDRLWIWKAEDGSRAVALRGVDTLYQVQGPPPDRGELPWGARTVMWSENIYGPGGRKASANQAVFHINEAVVMALTDEVNLDALSIISSDNPALGKKIESYKRRLGQDRFKDLDRYQHRLKTQLESWNPESGEPFTPFDGFPDEDVVQLAKELSLLLGDMDHGLRGELELAPITGSEFSVRDHSEYEMLRKAHYAGLPSIARAESGENEELSAYEIRVGNRDGFPIDGASVVLPEVKYFNSLSFLLEALQKHNRTQRIGSEIQNREERKEMLDSPLYYGL